MSINDHKYLFKALAANTDDKLLVLKLFKIVCVFDICSSIFFGLSKKLETTLNIFCELQFDWSNSGIISFLAAIFMIFANLVFTNIFIIKKFIKPILYMITDGILALHISRDIVPDLETANTDFFKIFPSEVNTEILKIEQLVKTVLETYRPD